ncbi:MAG: helix-turn-helix transcriptional regulator [Oscillospiraceae bacterium]|jgi:transcriptional regulator with XRE-family HTH domain|nr:helix-turn-helix transcriptional regulator [Oscillospiraceae bacterium]
MEIGTIIRELRAERGLTQEQLAEQIGVTAQAVSKWENGAGLPDISQIVPLARAFAVSTDVLFDTRDEPNDAARLAEYEKRERIWVDEARANGASYEEIAEKYIAFAREGVREFPRNYEILLRLASTLKSYGDKPEQFREALSIAERIISECKDERLVKNANWFRSFVLDKIGERELAFEAANGLDYAFQCREAVITQLIADEHFKGNSVHKDIAMLRDCVRAFEFQVNTALGIIRGVEAKLGIVNDDELLALLNLQEQIIRLYLSWDAVDDGVDDTLSGHNSREQNEENLVRILERKSLL